ncbi:Efflux pump dotC like protein [Verticillium longisporum]|nr:Efflux pump dotC like protein [Verticillium longisporum]
MLAVALPASPPKLLSISEELGGSSVDAFWTATSFLVAAAVVQPLWSTQRGLSLATTTFLLALALFTFGSALALMVRNFALMMTARCIQGVGAGGLIALIVTELFTKRERLRWFGAIALQWAVWTAAGPIIGGTIAQTSDWRWISWINLPLCLVVIVLLPIVSLVATLRDVAAWQHARLTLLHLDLLGALLFTVSLTSLLIAWSWGV